MSEIEEVVTVEQAIGVGVRDGRGDDSEDTAGRRETLLLCDELVEPRVEV